MGNPYCLLCGNRDKSVSYYTFPKNEESCKKWLAFCGIDKQVLNTATKLCSNHFQKDDIILKAKGTIVKPNAVPSIISKKKRSNQHSDLIIREDCSLKKLKGASWHDRTVVDDKSSDNIDVDNVNFDNRTVENFEFVSVDEDPTASLIETLNCPSTPPSIESIQIPVQPAVKTVRTPRYIGDIKPSHLDTPRKADLALQLAKRTIAKQQRKIKTLQQARNRLLARITTMEGLIKRLKEKKDL
ncbi:unnamed protein product [Lasius platythorax]|uniref:THAP-type domain-containing protein n=1 Tax=Lasius platythorax TaxID=488582 RepID=A0AAV2P6F5_9HYME